MPYAAIMADHPDACPSVAGIAEADVTTPEGGFFVREDRNEVILGQPHRVKPDFHDLVRYECQSDLTGRIEVLSTADQDVERNHASDPIVTELPEHAVDEQHLSERDVHSEPKIEQWLEAEMNSEPPPVEGEPERVRKQGSLLAALFGRRRWQQCTPLVLAR